MLSTAYLPVAPLGAGDLIDRAVRLYRRHLWTLVRIAAPPVIVAALGGVLCTIAWHGLTSAPDNSRLALYVFLLLFAVILLAGGQVFNLVVMGGATRNLVAHLLKNEPVSARATYSAVRMRFWSLIGATIMIVMWGLLSSMIALFGWYFVFAIIAIGVVGLAQFAPTWMTTLVFVLGAVAATVVALWLFFVMIARVAYVPQVMLVEGRTVFES